jgi:hypothetical protein
MRVAVIEATKRFEEEQTRRAREILESLEGKRNVGAGLVMRHGLKKQISTQAVRDWLKKSQEEQAKQLDIATKRGGRGKSRRKKTISDMTGMLSDLGVDVGTPLESGSFDVMPLVFNSPADEVHTKLSESDSILNLGAVDIDDFPPIREATIPGVFRVSKDPFSMGGRYGL